MSNSIWDEWFDTQYDLNNAIDKAIRERTKGKSDQLRLALYSSVIENAAEAMRAFIPDVSLEKSDVPASIAPTPISSPPRPRSEGIDGPS